MTLSRAGVVAGQDITSEAALTKLAYLLALPGATPDTVARDMSVSLRGELTVHAQTVFRHPNGVISDQARILTALGYAIASGDLETVKQVTNGEHEWVFNDADYSGNTPLVSPLKHLPCDLRVFGLMILFRPRESSGDADCRASLSRLSLTTHLLPPSTSRQLHHL
jgi:hypothetical protein